MKNDPDITLVPIEKRFDDEGEPMCMWCPFLRHDSDHGPGCSVATFTQTRGCWAEDKFRPGPNCPVHNPKPDQEAL